MNGYFLEIIVFSTGAIIMILELVGSRVLAPYVGISLYVWTSLIGVVLGSLAWGYHLGGKLADKKADYTVLGTVLLISAIYIIVFTGINHYLLTLVMYFLKDIKIASIICSMVAFTIPAVLLGMVTPISVKLKLKSLSSSASTVGNLYSISTIGSIFGTFLAGFFLITYFGTIKLLFLLGACLTILAFLCFIQAKNKSLVGKSLIVVLIVFFSSLIINLFSKPSDLLADLDTAYHRVWIKETFDEKTKKTMRVLMTDPTTAQSGMFLEDNNHVFSYLHFYDLSEIFNPNPKRILVIGGAAFSYPKYLLEKYPNALVDVVEIDPGFLQIAQKHFKLDDNPKLSIYHQDARMFYKQSPHTYDLIFLDAFNSHTIPFHLTTYEALTQMSSLLTDDGLVFINLISASYGPKSKFLQAEHRTLTSIFKNTLTFGNLQNMSSTIPQNVVVVAANVSLETSHIPNDQRKHLVNPSSFTSPLVLTDNFAPIDQYMMAAIN